MRTLWSGTISFGLVTIPVKLVGATEDRSVRFNQLRASDHSRLGYQRVAKADDEPVDYDDVVKGYEFEPGTWVVFDKEELEALKPASSKTVEIQQFVPLPQIDPIYFARSYYVTPEESGKKAYGLLAEAMASTDAVALCTITLRDKEHLATLRLREGALVLATMHWPDEVKDVDRAELGIDDLPEPRSQEVAMAEQLIASLTEDFTPAAYRDSYREQVLQAAQAKVEGKEVVAAGDEEEPAPVVDLMEALKRSVEGSSGSSARSDAGEATSKRTAKKATRKTTKKTTGKTAKKAAKKATKKAAASKRTGSSPRKARKAS